ADLPGALGVGDFNGDGNPDVIVEQIFSSDGSRVSESVLLGNGDGTFQAPISQVLGQALTGLAVADFNGDGKLAVATSGFDFTGPVHVFPGNGDGTFGSPGVFQTGLSNNGGPAAGDFNGDGRPDLVTAKPNGNTVGVLLNTSTVATATALSTDVNPAVVGQLVNLTATVTGPAGVPTGTVTFLDGDTVLGTATLDGTGTASLAVAFDTEGDHALTAVYGGDPNFVGSSQALTEQVIAATTGLQQGGFEAPDVGTGSFGAFAYDPVGSAWTFDEGSGVAGNGSGFTDGNPNAPQGSQVALLQGAGSFSQALSLAAGTYSLSFAAAQRGNFQASAQTLQVLVDGVVVGTFTPADTSYGAFTTNAFTVAAGAHTVAFVGLNPQGGDNT